MVPSRLAWPSTVAKLQMPAGSISWPKRALAESGMGGVTKTASLE